MQDKRSVNRAPSSEHVVSLLLHVRARKMVANTTSVILQSIITILNITSEQEDVASYNYYLLNVGQDFNGTRCYGMYGCFELSPPWTSEHRPVSLFPESIPKVEPRLTYYSREDPLNGTRIDLNVFDVVYTSGIDPDRPLYLISHGFMEGGDRPWIRHMTKELLKKEDCNVMVVDWLGGSSPPYTQAVANIRLVGAITAHVLAEVAQYSKNGNLDHVHCIGHSLGAHLSGYIGYTLQKVFNLTLGRITGMDPAGPHFANAQRPVRLDRSAARFVDVVHTDTSEFMRGGLGIREAIGHVDYYPNGGSEQPGCDRSVMEYAVENGGSFFRGIKKFLGCNHVRSHEYFAESINSKCSFLSISCRSFEDFKNGNCFDCTEPGKTCLSFGFNSRKQYEEMKRKGKVAKNKGIVQYFLTGDNPPFCKGHYKVEALVSSSSESKMHGGEVGRLWLVMHSTTDQSGPRTQRTPLSRAGYHEPGQTYAAVVASDVLQSLRAVEVEWDHESSMFNPLSWRLLASPRLYVDRLKVESLELRRRITVCPKSGKPLITGIPQLMLPSYC